MTKEKTVYTETFVASEDLSSSSQYRAVTLDGNRTIDLLDATTDIPCGILLDEPGDGQEALVGVLGRFPVVFGETVTAGKLIRAGSDARILNFDVDTDVTAYCLGQCTVGGATGEVGEAMINGINPWRGEE